MKTNKLRDFIQEILNPADITLNGNQPWDIKVLNEKFYRRVLSEGSLGLGESYMDGWWECEKLDEFFNKLLPVNPEANIKKNWKLVLHLLGGIILNKGHKSRAFKIGERHYDIGNELYKAMLDKRLAYSCGYWKEAKTLDEAQEAKLDLICRKLNLQPGMRVLDIGCGWASFAKYAAEKYRVSVFGVTVSREQAELGKEICRGLPVEIRLQDYRDVNEKFDHIVSVGMFEHVCPKNYRTYMQMARRCLRDKGLFLLHTIGNNKSELATDPWIDKYIFPNSLVPSIKQISASLEGIFIVEDWHNFGADYDPTLMAWFENFDKNWHTLRQKYDERFYRMWKYYLLSCAGVFRCRYSQLWQIVLSANGVAGGYRSIR